jgi:hypothetical protein
MADPVEEYLDQVVRRARLPRRRARNVRAELKDHLTALVEESRITNPLEVRTMLEDQFGNPSQIGNSLHVTYPRRSRGKRLLICCAIVAAIWLGVRATVAEAFYAVTDAAGPQVPMGSRCLVLKRFTGYAAGDVIAFHHDSGNTTWLGIVKNVDDVSGAITVGRKDRPDLTVTRSQVVGRVIANTR